MEEVTPKAPEDFKASGFHLPALERSAVLRTLSTRFDIKLLPCAPDGNCLQRAALASVGNFTPRQASSKSPKVLSELLSQRVAVVEGLMGADSNAVRSHLNLDSPAGSQRLQAYAKLGSFQWGDAFTAFLYGVAAHLDRSIVVLNRDGDKYTDPCSVYRYRAPRRSDLHSQNGGVYCYLPYDEVLSWLGDVTLTEWPPFALLEYFAAELHFSPLVIGERRLERASYSHDGSTSQG